MKETQRTRRRHKAKKRRDFMIVGLMLHGWGTTGSNLTDGKQIFGFHGTRVVELLAPNRAIVLEDHWERIQTPCLRIFYNSLVRNQP